MGHAADLPRQILILLFSFVLPANQLRYLYTILMLLAGGIGTYFFLKDHAFKNSQNARFASLAGSFFYLFNLGTLQMFYVPFEPYSAHFAAIPWLFWANFKFWKNANRKNLLLLVLVNFLAIPQGYVITFFLVYFIFLTLVVLFYLRPYIAHFKRIFITYLLLFAINAFWLLPNLYFVVNHVSVNSNSKINEMATDTNYLQNKKYGNISDVVLLKGFWFDIAQQDQKNNLDFLMGEWESYTQRQQFKILGYSLFLISLIGLLLSYKRKRKEVYIFIPAFLLSFTVMANNTPIFSWIDYLLYKIPLFYQAFRFPFTKFATIIAFSLSIFYAFTCLTLIDTFKKWFFVYPLTIIFLILPLAFLSPVFQGKLFASQNHIAIPTEYFQVFNFFKNQNPNTRIANFPQQTYWGWQLYRWQYQGSGFLWYGIKQPILDRAFDVWSSQDENYYWEISNAIYSRNQELFENTLEKYQINWILLDKNIINPSSPKALYDDELEGMLTYSSKTTLAAVFGKVSIYKVDLNTPVNNFVYFLQNPATVAPVYNWNNFDQAFVDNNHYISNATDDSLVYYPFRSLFTGKNQDDLSLDIRDLGNSFVFQQKIPKDYADYKLQVPEGKLEELLYVDPNNLENIDFKQVGLLFNKQSVEVNIPKVGGYYSYNIDPATDPQIKDPHNCNSLSTGTVKNEIVQEKDGNNYLRLSAQNATNCSAGFWLPNLSHKFSYLITVKSKNVKGRSLLFWLENQNNRKSNIETYLPSKNQITTSYFIQPPMEQEGDQYSLHFDEISIGDQKTINELGEINVYPIPYHYLSELKLVSPDFLQTNSQTLPVLNVKHSNPSVYEISQLPVTNYQSPTLVLSQSFEKGWEAYRVKNGVPSLLAPIVGEKLGEHVLVDNWANGWTLKTKDNQDKTYIAIIFVPQFLEYLGFIFLITTVLVAWKIPAKIFKSDS